MPQSILSSFSFPWSSLKIYKLQFSFSGKLLNLIFPLHGLFFRKKALIIHKRHRTLCFCIFGTVSATIMSLQAFLQTVCPSCIKSPVCTLYHICIIHASSVPHLCKGQPSVIKQSQPQIMVILFFMINSRYHTCILISTNIHRLLFLSASKYKIFLTLHFLSRTGNRLQFYFPI